LTPTAVATRARTQVVDPKHPRRSQNNNEPAR
jgi:hypothetical protein